jgi:hypothetical protein
MGTTNMLYTIIIGIKMMTMEKGGKDGLDSQNDALRCLIAMDKASNKEYGHH